jgi:hypothetical protein
MRMGFDLRWRVGRFAFRGDDMEPIGLDPNDVGVLFEPKDWLECSENPGLMHHLPSHAEFFVELADKHPGDVVTIMDFRAYLIREPMMEVSHDELVAWGRGAVAVYLIERGYWNPVISDVPEKPKQCRRLKPRNLSR